MAWKEMVKIPVQQISLFFWTKMNELNEDYLLECYLESKQTRIYLHYWSAGNVILLMYSPEES